MQPAAGLAGAWTKAMEKMDAASASLPLPGTSRAFRQRGARLDKFVRKMWRLSVCPHTPPTRSHLFPPSTGAWPRSTRLAAWSARWHGPSQLDRIFAVLRSAVSRA